MLFTYDYKKDILNCTSSTQYGSNCVHIPLNGHHSILNILAKSQPPSIYCSSTSCLKLFPARSSVLNRALLLPNNYELFLSSWLADGIHSYPHASIREDWKKWFPSGHNAVSSSDNTLSLNSIPPSAFDNTRCLFDTRLKFVIKNHSDADNYWHWTFEWLPRLFILAKYFKHHIQDDQLIFICIGKPLNSFQREWINLILGSQVSIKTFLTPLLCDHLLWITPPFPAHHSVSTVSEIRHRIFTSGAFRSLSRPGYLSKKVYLLRGDARNGRRLANEPEVLDQLTKLGFVAIAMDGLSVFEQALIFSSADIIVGAHGSAFVNMIFCNPDCRIIEFFGPGYLSGHDFSLSSICKLHWQFIEGDSVCTNSSFTSDFSIDCKQLLNML